MTLKTIKRRRKLLREHLRNALTETTKAIYRREIERYDREIEEANRPTLKEAVKHFIEVNQEDWKGQSPTDYLNEVREKVQ